MAANIYTKFFFLEINSCVFFEKKKLQFSYLRDDVKIGDERTLQDNRNVTRVEQLDRVRAGLAAESSGFDRQVDTEALEVDDNGEDEHGSQQVGQVGQVLAIEGFLERTDLVVAGREQVEQSDDGALEFGTTAGVDGGRAERLPHDRLANVGGNEQGDTRAQTVALLQKLVQEQHNQASNEQLENIILNQVLEQCAVNIKTQDLDSKNSGISKHSIFFQTAILNFWFCTVSKLEKQNVVTSRDFFDFHPIFFDFQVWVG